MAGWPTAAAIDARIALSERVNGRSSELHGMGRQFMRLGRRYGINPAIVVAIAQRECQLGADGSYLPTVGKNFGGVTYREWRGDCPGFWYRDRWWACWQTAEAGLKGIYEVLDAPVYRKTDGTFGEIMRLYSPPFENNWIELWRIMRAVGDQLGVELGPGTKVYGKPRWRMPAFTQR